MHGGSRLPPEGADRDQGHLASFFDRMDHRCAQKVQTSSRSPLRDPIHYRLVHEPEKDHEEPVASPGSFHTPHCRQVRRDLSTRDQGLPGCQRKQIHEVNGPRYGKGNSANSRLQSDSAELLSLPVEVPKTVSCLK